MALNMLSCRFSAEFTRTLKKSKQRRNPNTTEEAVKPEKTTEKKPPSVHYNAILVPTVHGHPCFIWTVIKDAEWCTKADKFHLVFSFSDVFSLFLTIWSQMLIYGSEYTAWKEEKAGSHREEIRTIQQQRGRKELLSPCTAEAHIHIHWALKALGHSQKNWLTHSEPY